MARGFSVLRDVCIEQIGSEARSVVARKSGGGERRCHSQQRHGQKLFFHDSLHESPDFLTMKQSEGVAGDYMRLQQYLTSARGRRSTASCAARCAPHKAVQILPPLPPQKPRFRDDAAAAD
jgi:hypothetical protein